MNNIAIIKIQRRYRFLNNELKILSYRVIFLKACLIDMSNNLIQLNKMKLYDNVANGYNPIYNELLYIKKKINKYPDTITLRYLIKINIYDIRCELYEIKTLILQYVNHISMQNMNLMLILLLGSNWRKLFTYEENKILELLIRLFNPINIWDSSIHTKPVNYMEGEGRHTPISKKTLDTIIESNNDTISSIMIGTNSFPNFLKGLTNIIIKERTISKIERKKDFNYIELSSLFTNSNIILTKNTNPISLIEDKQGFNVVIKINDRIIAIQGMVKDDSLELYKTNNIIANEIKLLENYIIY